MRLGSAFILGGALSATLLFADKSRAEGNGAHATREYRVEFSADHVEVDGNLGALELDGHVRVQAQRYRLTSPHLELKRGPRGVESSGSADVAFCTCDDPPVRLEVKQALLAPPTDALFGRTVLVVGGVPVLWLPALWLRAPTRPGLTLPRLAYRGKDGVFVGDSAYLPLEVQDGRVTKSLTLGGGAYVLHGARIDGELDTEMSSSRVAWDHVGQSALELDAHGSAPLSDATFAYRIDALRGARAPVESSVLEVAARRTDRAAVSVAHVDELALGFALRADAPRAGALKDFGAAGPELYLGAANALGENASYDTFGTARTTVMTGNHSQTALAQRGTLNANARPGPVGVGLVAGESAELQVGELRNDGVLRGGLGARIGLPLARSFGALSHYVEPVIVGRGLVEAEPRGNEAHTTRTLLAAAGADTSLGDRSRREAASLSARGGVIERAGEDPSAAQLVAMARLTADARYAGAAESFAVLGPAASTVSLSRVRLGATDSLHLLLRADGASHGSPAQARVLFDESWLDPARPFLDRDGWSGGSELAIPWTRAFSTSGSIDYDLTEKSLLGAWGGFGYRHPCGCLAVSSFVGHRVGRQGVDAWLGFDLAP